jgi:hypothetical protein
MAVSLIVKRKFIVNGKEYGSIDELPEAIRKALKSQISTKFNKETSLDAVKTKIVFNHQEYANTDEMPQDVREAYQRALQAAGLTAPEETATQAPRSSNTFLAQKAIVPASGASGFLRALLLLGGLILMLYLVFSFLKYN